MNFSLWLLKYSFFTGLKTAPNSAFAIRKWRQMFAHLGASIPLINPAGEVALQDGKSSRAVESGAEHLAAAQCWVILVSC